MDASQLSQVGYKTVLEQEGVNGQQLPTAFASGPTNEAEDKCSCISRLLNEMAGGLVSDRTVHMRVWPFV